VLGLTVLRAGVCEEILFRGYAIERMTALTGSRVIGIVVPALCFMFGHAGTFGPLYALQILPVTAILTALYVWRRDIWCNMLAHFLTDAFGLAPFVLAQHHH
jgi:membrane protease YdiL (CAAX protease family)